MSDKKTREKQAKLISQLAEICEELEWVMALPNEKTVSGLIIGTEEYVTATAKKVYSDFEVLSPGTKQQASDPFPEESMIVELTEEEYNKFLETGELPEAVSNPVKPTIYH